MEQVDGENERRLICAVLLHAVKDSVGVTRGSRNDRLQARHWLTTEQAHEYAELVGLGNVWPPSEATLLELKKSLPNTR